MDFDPDFDNKQIFFILSVCPNLEFNDDNLRFIENSYVHIFGIFIFSFERTIVTTIYTFHSLPFFV